MMGSVSPSHGPRRAQVVFTDTARAQVEKLAPAELRAADRLVVAISANPELGEQVPRAPLRRYAEGDAMVLYFATALGSIIVVAYIEA